jgi:hypothetical protein
MYNKKSLLCKIILLLINISGCAMINSGHTKIDFEDVSYLLTFDKINTTNCKIIEKEQIRNVLLLFYNDWYEYFGDNHYKVLNSLSNLKISCSDTKKTLSSNYYKLDGVKGKRDASISGISYDINHIWFFIENEHNLCHSSLIHELVHISLGSTSNRSWDTNLLDPDHEGNKYPGWTAKHTSFIEITKMECLNLSQAP